MDQHARTPRSPAMSPAHAPQLPFEHRPHPFSLPSLISSKLTISRALLLPLILAGVPRPSCRPSSPSEAARSHTELRPEPTFLFLFLPTAPASVFAAPPPPSRAAPPAGPAPPLPAGPALPCRALVRGRAPYWRPNRRRRPKAAASASSRRHRPEPPSTAVQSSVLPPSTAAVQSTPPSSPLKAPIVRLILRRCPCHRLRAVSARHAVAEPKRRRPRPHLRAGRGSRRPPSPTPPSPRPNAAVSELGTLHTAVPEPNAAVPEPNAAVSEANTAVSELNTVVSEANAAISKVHRS
eukprot:XP_020407715.1 vegetative cell wall protein gp1-like [Zea mays]